MVTVGEGDSADDDDQEDDGSAGDDDEQDQRCEENTFGQYFDPCLQAASECPSKSFGAAAVFSAAAVTLSL